MAIHSLAIFESYCCHLEGRYLRGMNIKAKGKKRKTMKSTAARLKELESRVKKVEAVAQASFRHAVRADRAIELLYSAKAKKRAAKK